MLGIGHRLEKETKKKILAEKAKQYNQKYDQLVAQGREAEAAKLIEQQEYQRRHEVPANMEPYRNTNRVNELGGAVNLGYDRTGKDLTTTQAMHKTMEEHLTKTKQGYNTGLSVTEDKEDFNRMKKRIYKDHLAEDKEIDLNEPKLTDYTRNFRQDEKLLEQTKNRDKTYNQKMNDLKEYAESYIKSKSSLRKC